VIVGAVAVAAAPGGIAIQPRIISEVVPAGIGVDQQLAAICLVGVTKLLTAGYFQ
jgi:hypothetical protein